LAYEVRDENLLAILDDLVRMRDVGRRRERPKFLPTNKIELVV